MKLFFLKKLIWASQWIPEPHPCLTFLHSDDKSKDTESGSSKLDAPKPAAIQSSPLEEKKDPGKLQINISGADDDDESDEDYVDSEEGESNDNEVCTSVKLWWNYKILNMLVLSFICVEIFMVNKVSE